MGWDEDEDADDVVRIRQVLQCWNKAIDVTNRLATRMRDIALQLTFLPMIGFNISWTLLEAIPSLPY